MADAANFPAYGSGEAPGPRVFRRQSSVIGGFVIGGIVVIIGIALTPGEVSHGLLAALAPLGVTVPLALILLAFMASPRIVVRDDHLEVHNSFITYEIPYPAIDELRQTRMGLLVRTVGGKSIPVTAYATGAGAKVMKHSEQADEVIRAAQNNMEFAHTDEDLPPVLRRPNTRNLVAILLSVVIGVAIAIGAAHTYH